MRRFLGMVLAVMLLAPVAAAVTDPAVMAQKGSKTYVVRPYVCGATFTKEANKRFTKYSAAGNTRAIDAMLAKGELVVLRRGERVTMVEKGYLLSKVRRARGQVVYTDTENLSGH